MEEQTSITTLLSELEQAHGALNDRWKLMLEVYEGAVYGLDLLAAAALNRSRANLSAFQQLVRDRNLVIAGALLRLQIDTALRFYAAFLVDEPHTFALEVLRGERIDRAKDSEGKHLRDGYLVSKLSAEYPWISRVYNRTSSYIHLSATHIHHAFDIPEDAASFTLKISDVDRELPEELYAEAILAFGEATKILLKYIDGWIYTKANPEHVRRLKEEDA